MLSTFSSVFTATGADAGALATGAGATAGAGGSSFLPQPARTTADKANDQRYFFIMKTLRLKDKLEITQMRG
jgi:hypothetical protein